MKADELEKTLKEFRHLEYEVDMIKTNIDTVDVPHSIRVWMSPGGPSVDVSLATPGQAKIIKNALFEVLCEKSGILESLRRSLEGIVNEPR